MTQFEIAEIEMIRIINIVKQYATNVHNKGRNRLKKICSPQRLTQKNRLLGGLMTRKKKKTNLENKRYTFDLPSSDYLSVKKGPGTAPQGQAFSSSFNFFISADKLGLITEIDPLNPLDKLTEGIKNSIRALKNPEEINITLVQTISFAVRNRTK